MATICNQCGKTIEGEGISFCPYCGAKITEEEAVPEVRNEEAEKWIKKAMAVTSYPERKKILLQGLAEYPDSREIRWELLFIGGDEPVKRGRAIDFSIIKCWVLEFYRKPGDFSKEQRDRMRSALFDSEQLKSCLALYDNPERKQQEYLQRLCNEYVEIFLEGNSQVMGNWFGFTINRNREKKLALPVSEMIRNIQNDKELNPQQREQLWKCLYQAYGIRANGKTEHLDALLG